MSEISTHILDSITGRSAVGIRVQLLRLSRNGNPDTVFDVASNEEGRVLQFVDVAEEGEQFELIFHSADYFASTLAGFSEDQNVNEVIVRFSMKDREKKYHVPLVLSPHSHTVWWSE
jgi:5-hydroxyisourate hydrolase